MNRSPLMKGIERLVWFDLTAGNAAVSDEEVWIRDCSPGILAYHARNSIRPLDLNLFEIQPGTFDELLSNLTEQLPQLGYVRVGDCHWRYADHVNLYAAHDSGAEAPVDNITGRTHAVLAVNDPNAITSWAMRPTFAQEVAERTPWFRSISTMGCNPGGLKMLKQGERLKWFHLVEQQERALPQHRDLLLAAIERDASQWAYLICEPIRWRDKVEIEARKAFEKQGLTLDLAWFRGDSERYQEIKRELFLTKAERNGSAA